MQASFDNTVQILVKAFLEGTLRKRDCAACAVGNICAAALGATISLSPASWMESEWSKSSPQWAEVFCIVYPGEPQRQHPERYKGEAKGQIDATGYTWEQLARIECAFEAAHSDWNGEAAEFAGLMAVVDVLADIHGIDLATAEVAKGLFVRA